MKLKESNNCSVFYTAGFPELNSTEEIAISLEAAGVDLIELGIPFSDPMADGTTIQISSNIALKNGMTIDVLFEQVERIKKTVNIPIVLMGYLNPIFQYGMKRFVRKCASLNVDGLIIPDLPIEIYEKEYLNVFCSAKLPLIFLITPQTSEERIRKIEKHSKSFIYLVSSSSITGKSKGFGASHEQGFKRIKSLNLKVPVFVGFGIGKQADFEFVNSYFDGAIIGSAFIRWLQENKPVGAFVKQFVKQ